MSAPDSPDTPNTPLAAPADLSAESGVLPGRPTEHSAGSPAEHPSGSPADQQVSTPSEPTAPPVAAPIANRLGDNDDDTAVRGSVADDAPATGPLHTVAGGPDWHSRPSGALYAQQVPGANTWAQPAAHAPQAGRPGAAPGTQWYGRPAQPTGPFSSYQSGPTHTRTDLPPLAPIGTTTAVAERPRNRGKTPLVVAGTVALALVAGFGGGLLGNQVSSVNNAASDSSLTQQSTAAPASLGTGISSVESVANTVLPSVVSILATSSSGGGEGSGIVLSADGLILTNNHVIESAEDLTVRFNDGTTATATVVGADPTDDLAVIKADGVSNLTPATLGSSGDLVVGQQVVAIGSPLGLSATVTTGIVSALNRPVRTASSEEQQQQQQQDPFGQGQQDPGQSTTTTSGTVLNAIQTDAAINPGNSGGALVDMNGHVIGINSAIATMSDGSSQSGSIGVGFAIPIDQAKRIADEIIAGGKAEHAVLGASVRDNAATEAEMPDGALIAELVSGSGAEQAGLKVGDVVTKVGDLQVESADALIAAIRSQQPGGTVDITYVRGSDSDTIKVTLGKTSE